MSIAERKEREKQEMKNLIIQGAMEVFLELGYEKTSIRTIADRIDYSPATIYLYFKDKDSLFLEVQHVSFGLLIQEMAGLADLDDPVTQLREMGYRYIQFGIEHPGHYDLMFIINDPLVCLMEDEKEWHNGHQMYQVLVGVVERCIQRKLIRMTDPQLATLMIWSAVHGLVALHCRNRLWAVGISPEAMPSIGKSYVDQFIETIRT